VAERAKLKLPKRYAAAKKKYAAAQKAADDCRG
jgi:hypothetical protein